MHKTLVIVPGVDDSGPGHWQSILQRTHPGSRRVVQEDWSWPVREDWCAALARTIAATDGDCLLVAHSAGVLTVAAWAMDGGDAVRIAGALLVAPPDFETPRDDGMPVDLLADAGWVPAPRRALPFPSIVVASSDDPWSSLERARGLALDWGSRFVALEGAGHVNAESGYGEWPLATRLLEELANPG